MPAAPAPAPAPPAAAPWQAADLFPPKPAGHDYGYRLRGQNYPCTRDELLERFRAGDVRSDLVWTPEATHLVPAEEVAFLRDVLRERTRRDLASKLKYSLVVLGAWSALVVLTWQRGQSPLLYLMLVIMLAVPLALQDAWGLRRLRREGDRYLLEEAGTLRYQIWLGLRRIVTTYLLAACIILAGLAQWAGRGTGVDAAGLVKGRVWADGEWWRLLTGALLHGHILHFAFNFVALFALGRLTEVHGHPVYVPVIFLFSALCGSLLSLWTTATTSVGASGGLMGLIGFLAVLGYRRRHVLPPGFLKSIMLSIALTAAAGLVAWQFIDNAAHAGGLLGGLLLGVVYVRRRRSTEFRLRPSKPAVAAGWSCAAGLVALTVWTVWKIFTSGAG